MNTLKSTDSLKGFQELIGTIYGLADDRAYSIWDLHSNIERYTLRALKGIRKGDSKRIRLNLMIALTWACSLSNRLRIDLEAEVWKRFPYQCSYCGHCPCACQTKKPEERPMLLVDDTKRPQTIKEMQKMFEIIYPSSKRTLIEGGIHLAEEIGEISEAIHVFMGEHKSEQVAQIQLELADYISCVFGVANSVPFDVASKLIDMYKIGCPVCGESTCICTFSVVAQHVS